MKLRKEDTNIFLYLEKLLNIYFLVRYQRDMMSKVRT